MTKLPLLLALTLIGCSAAPAREPMSDGTAGETGFPYEPTCEPVTCDGQVSSAALAYFTSPDCSEGSRLVPIAPNDPVSSWTLCDDVGRAWVTSGKVEAPAQVWGGAECVDMSGALNGFEWWAVVELERCE